MSRLEWDVYPDRNLEIGIDRGVFYPDGQDGIPWNGLSSVQSTPEDFVHEYIYQDNVKVDHIEYPGLYTSLVEAYTYPDELEEQEKPFGLAYRTGIVSPLSEDYKIHLVYNAIAVPDVKTYKATIADTSSLFSWAIVTQAIPIPYSRPATHFIADSRFTHPDILEEFESFIYGSEVNPPRLPSIDKLLTIFGQMGILEIIDHGDGTFSAIGPDHMASYISEDEYRITAASAVPIDEYTFTVSSL